MPDTLPRGRTDERSKARGYDPETDAQEDDWDRQIEEDAKAGRLGELADRARKQASGGETRRV